MRKVIRNSLFFWVLCGGNLIASPWFTGPLLTPGPSVVAEEVIALSTSFFATENLGYYDNRWKFYTDTKSKSYNWQFSGQVGFVEKWDISFAPQLFYNIKEGARFKGWGDCSIGLNYQLYCPAEDSVLPKVKLSMKEVFPTGRYKNLRLDKKGTDATGGGAYATTLGVVLGKLYVVGGHDVSVRGSMSATFFSDVHVRNLNSYGGQVGTSGKVSLGNFYSFMGGVEYAITRNWGVALDVVGVVTEKSCFSGELGEGVGGPSRIQYSLAPAVEYNFSGSLGVVAGVWFSVVGRNDTDFVSGVVTMNYSF